MVSERLFKVHFQHNLLHVEKPGQTDVKSYNSYPVQQLHSKQ